MTDLPTHSHACDHANPHGHANPQGHTHTHGHACNHGSLADHDPASDIICLDRVSYAYPVSRLPGEPPRAALRDITLHIERGCNLGIIGPNGAGKSTLLKIILGLIDDYEGSVSIEGMSPRLATRRGGVIGYVPQRIDVEWRMPVSAWQVVRMGLVGKAGLFRRVSRGDRDYAREMLGRVGMTAYARKPVADLSGGQQQRLFIARALAARPRVLILDEPMVGIDEAGQQQFADLIHELHESLQLTVLIVSHDLQAIARGCNRVAVLNQTLHYHDAPAGLTQDVLDEVFRHDLVPMP